MKNSMTCPKIIISGASGLIGSALVPALRAEGATVIRLVRQKPQGDDEIFWQPDAYQLDAKNLEGATAIIHLAGENIAAKRWTNQRKRRILQNRAKASQLLHETVSRLENPPETLIIASAVGYYGITPAPVTEDAAPGTGFAAEVCGQIEAPTPPAGVRTVYARFGVVTTQAGGAIGKMKPAFQLGLGGRLGSGRQPFPWISRPDAVRALQFILKTPEISGPVNVVAPAQNTNAHLTAALAASLNRPACLPMPAFMVKLLFGEMGEELLLNGSPVLPEKLQQAGFTWQNPTLEAALQPANA